MTSPTDHWVDAFDHSVKNSIAIGMDHAGVIKVILDAVYPKIVPRPKMADFVPVLNERIRFWSDVYDRDPMGKRRQHQNGQSGTASPAQTATLLDVAAMAVTSPIKPLAGILHPDELTIPFGTGGSGKGTLAVGIIVDLIFSYGYRVAILDYEGHSREWVARIKTLYRHRHLQDLPANSILYIAPNGPGSGLRIGSFLQHADDLRIACETAGVGYAVLDSVAGGAVLGMDPKDDQTATQFATAWQRLSLPMMALSHIPKNSPTTDYPYGSAYWHNLARATWFMEQTGRLTNGFVARLVNRKFNDADQQPSLLVEVQYTDDGWLESVDIVPDDGGGSVNYAGANMAKTAIAILARSGQAMTAQDVVDDWPGGGEVPEVEVVRKRLNELVLAGTIDKPTTGGRGPGSASTYSTFRPAVVPEGDEDAEVQADRLGL